MKNLDRLKRAVEEHREEDTVIETETSYVILNKNGLHIKTPDKSDENVQWTLDLISGQNPRRKG